MPTEHGVDRELGGSKGGYRSVWNLHFPQTDDTPFARCRKQLGIDEDGCRGVRIFDDSSELCRKGLSVPLEKLNGLTYPTCRVIFAHASIEVAEMQEHIGSVWEWESIWRYNLGYQLH